MENVIQKKKKKYRQGFLNTMLKMHTHTRTHARTHARTHTHRVYTLIGVIQNIWQGEGQ